MRGTFVLLLVLGLLGLALWWSSGDRPDARDGALTESALDGRGLRSAAHVAIRPLTDSVTIELGRDAVGDWRVEEPVRDVASEARIAALAVAFDSAELLPAWPDEEVTEELLEQSGLAAPRAEIRVRWPDGHRVALEIGATGPYGDDLFVRKGGRVFRAGVALHSALQGTPDDWREPLVFRQQAGHLRRVRVERARPGEAVEILEVARRGAGAWRLTEPADLRVDQGAAATFAHTLAALRVDRFLQGRAAESYGPEVRPLFTIEIEGERGVERVTLDPIGDGEAFVGYAESRGLWFDFGAPAVRSLLEVPVQQLRAHWLLDHAVDAIEEIRIDPGRGERPIVLRRRGRFRLEQPVAIAAEPRAVNELLQALRSLQVREFVEDDAEDLARYGLDADSRTTIELVVRPGLSPDVLHLGADAEDDAAYLRRADEPHVVTIPREVAARLRRDFTVYVTRDLPRVDSLSEVRAVRWRQEGREGFVRREGERFVRDPGGEEIDFRETFEQLCDDLDAVAVVTADGLELESLLELTPLRQGDRPIWTIELVRLPDGRVAVRREVAPLLLFVLAEREVEPLLAIAPAG